MGGKDRRNPGNSWVHQACRQSRNQQRDPTPRLSSDLSSVHMHHELCIPAIYTAMCSLFPWKAMRVKFWMFRTNMTWTWSGGPVVKFLQKTWVWFPGFTSGSWTPVTPPVPGDPILVLQAHVHLYVHAHPCIIKKKIINMTVIGMNTYDERHSFRFAPVASSMIKNITGFTKLLLNVIYVYIFRESQKNDAQIWCTPVSELSQPGEKKRSIETEGQQGNRKQGPVRGRHMSHTGHVEIVRPFLMYWMLPT